MGLMMGNGLTAILPSIQLFLQLFGQRMKERLKLVITGEVRNPLSTQRTTVIQL